MAVMAAGCATQIVCSTFALASHADTNSVSVKTIDLGRIATQQQLVITPRTMQ
eukprot:m.51754 g.51754  ORF g.51754 m.51754 type:complete len:53 (-) comp12245_c1_seq2:78-236(-)